MQQENSEDILTRINTAQRDDYSDAKKVELSQDVMNSSVSVELLEQELLRTQDTSFYFGFSTFHYPEMEIEKDKK